VCKGSIFAKVVYYPVHVFVATNTLLSVCNIGLSAGHKENIWKLVSLFNVFQLKDDFGHHNFVVPKYGIR
jgi:hypothetical protein